MEAASTNTVLLVEGDTALRRVIAMGLRHQGMSVLEAASPQQARALLDQRPSLLVVDVDSGLASDRKLLPDLRAYDGLADTPAVVLTWDCSPDLQEQVDSDGAAICLAKPFDARRLFAEAELLLEAAVQRRQDESAVAASVGSLSLIEMLNPATTPEMAAEALYEPAYGRVVEADEAMRASSPSIWPIVLALGLMVAISGLLIHPAIVALGVGIVVSSMLLWGFEPGVKPGRA
ncbi:MAG TPA: response regulator [Ktedonobacterales bacterium]|nr:response regulator [Ktedonobacterales bacterium]